MADYRQLLIKAIDALSENNGAQRREVYEKARKALVAQLRSITPPLPAREITQHRLELEDCIRQVEQEATENILGGLKQLDEEPVSIPPEPVVAPAPPPAPAPAPEPVQSEPSKPESTEPEPIEPEPAQPEPAKPAPQEAKTPVDPSQVEADTAAELTAALESEMGDTPERQGPVAEPQGPEAEIQSQEAETQAEEADGEDDVSSIDAIIARAEAARAHNPVVDSSPESSAPESNGTGAEENPASTPASTPARAPTPPPAPTPAAAPASAPSAGPAVVEVPKSTSVSDRAVGAAMSRVREVEVEFDAPGTDDPEADDDSQLAIDRAIAMLDREARGESDGNAETDEPDAEAGAESAGPPRPDDDAMLAGESRFMSNGDEEKGGNALTIFLVLAVLLLVGAGGAGYWAWREGYVDLDALFAQATSVTQPQPTSDQTETPVATGEDGPGNTATDPATPAPTETLSSEAAPTSDERLPGADTGGVPAGQTEDPNKVEDRLITDAPSATDAPIDSTAPDDAAATAGTAQSLLLEASADGTTGAVPFSGTVNWERDTDELGQPTLVGTANIPARNLGVSILIRRNADPTLPASHLVEIQFETSDTFVGGSIASFGGILLKNEELVPGRPLVGAPARVFENMFLFALSAAEPDVRTNLPLLENNKWIDLAIIYGTGRQAIITLEKDDAAQAMFDDVLAAWAETDQAEASVESSSQ